RVHVMSALPCPQAVIMSLSWEGPGVIHDPGPTATTDGFDQFTPPSSECATRMSGFRNELPPLAYPKPTVPMYARPSASYATAGSPVARYFLYGIGWDTHVCPPSVDSIARV